MLNCLVVVVLEKESAIKLKWSGMEWKCRLMCGCREASQPCVG